MLHIVYRGGTPAMNDLLAGHLPLQFATVAQALPQYKAGQLRALGISSAARYASVPEIPTFREQGSMWSRPSGTDCSRRPARRSRSSTSSMPR